MAISNSFNLGMSIAFSHGTANALIMGTILMQQQGLHSFLLWAIPNAACILIFGFIYHKGWIRSEILISPMVRFCMYALQCSMLLLELKLIQTFLLRFTDNVVWATALASLVSGAFIIGMLLKGLKGSIRLHLWQGWIALGSFSLGILYCITAEVSLYNIPQQIEWDWTWGAWTLCVYIASMIADLQHWERAKLDDSRSAFYWGTLIFSCLMFVIGGIAQFNLPIEVNIFLILPLLMLSTSTITSLSVAMHTCINKYVGSLILMIIVCGWWILLDNTALDVWNYHGILRCFTAILICSLSGYWVYRYK